LPPLLGSPFDVLRDKVFCVFFSLLQKVVLLWFKCFWLKDSLVLSSSFSLFFSLVRSLSLSCCFFLSFFFVLSVLSFLTPRKKNQNAREKVLLLCLCYWNIFSTVLVSFIIKRNNLNTPFARWWCRA
jgi:cbb3-type cytochrome oxidase subunit 3